MISENLYNKYIKGFHIYDCSVRENGIYSFLLCETLTEQNKEEPLKRIFTYFTKNEDGGFFEFSGFSHPNIAAAQHPYSQGIMISSDGYVASLGSHKNGLEPNIPIGNGLSLHTNVSGVASIDGYVYAVGGWRSVCRRIGPGQWENLADRANSMPVPPRRKGGGSSNTGFFAIGGFSATDIYCAGRNGDVWRYDGQRWHQCAVPTNIFLETVCCAGDGFVYLGGSGGTVLKGRENHWTILFQGEMTLPFKDMVWYRDRVWCTSDYGIWTIENDQLVDPELPAEIRSCSGNLAVGDGVMLLAGVYGAALYDGEDWEVIISKFVAEPSKNAKKT